MAVATLAATLSAPLMAAWEDKYDEATYLERFYIRCIKQQVKLYPLIDEHEKTFIKRIWCSRIHSLAIAPYLKIFHQTCMLCCNASISYNDINHDLINDALVDDVERIAREFGYPKIPVFCQERLDEALAELDQAWKITTDNIRLEQNTGFKLKETKNGESQWGQLLALK